MIPKTNINVKSSPQFEPKSFQWPGEALTTRPDKFFGHIIIFIILIHINIIYNNNNNKINYIYIINIINIY